jgi:hypothetical protein
LENDITSYTGSYGRATFSQPIQQFNAVRRDYTVHEPRETTILTTTPFVEPTPLHPQRFPFDRSDQVRQSTDSYKLERLPEQKYAEVKFATPTPSMRVRPPVVPHVGSIVEDLSMEKTVDINMGTHGQHSQQASYQYVGGSEGLQYASSTSRQTTEQLPARQLPIERLPDAERARLSSISPISTGGIDVLDKSDGVLVRDTIVQHVSEDEKSTTSEEVVFEEWSEEFLCRRTDEFDGRTNRLLRSIIDETSARVKGDVIKEEYREKNERIKGHRSYDIVKEVYRRVPASSTHDQTQSHLYEEIPQPPLPPPPGRQLPIEHTKRESAYSPTSRDRQWSTEDIYTTTIVTDRPRDTSHVHADRLPIKDDSSTPPSSTIARIYDRVRPGQFPPLPPTVQAIPSTTSSTTYDRISAIVGPTQRYADIRSHQHEREETVSEEYQVEVEQRHTDHRFSPQHQRPGSLIGIPQREDTSEEEISDGYQGLSRIINEAGRKPFTPTSTSTVREQSDWRTKLKQIHTPTSEEDRFEQFNRSREIITGGKTVITSEERPQPPKRSSSSSIIDERRARFEQQQQIESSTGPITSSKIDRSTFGRVGELKNAFEATTTTTGNGSTSKYTSPTMTTTGLTEQRRRLFEEQEQAKKDWTTTTSTATATTTTRRPPHAAPAAAIAVPRRVHRLSSRRRAHLVRTTYYVFFRLLIR